MKILYIDDESDLLEIISEYVDNNYKWDLVTNSKDALNKLKTNNYDFAIIDFLSNLKSVDLMDYMTEKNIKFVLFTGDAELKNLPIENVVIKPDINSLFNIIEETKKAA